ncbi:neprilysin-1-like isoform X1 [Tetranychus urticae]|uniref:neprilysin-1-like isoform X1 n=2 Tax=Tetranychus urticae TaxID=32264 RepID=UPI00077C0E29|nr:neprilysin-1-like isoform X1 [Tetranychus urticae]
MNPERKMSILIWIGTFFSLLIVLLFVISFSLYCDPAKSSFNPNSICLTSECVKTASSLLSAMDITAEPCNDFFQYACGNWNKKHIIPEDRSSISTFEVLAENLQLILRNLLEEPASSHDNSATIKAKTFYKSCMNIEEVVKVGDIPLKKTLSDLGDWPVTNKKWTKPNWSFEELLGRLRGDYNQGIIIEQWIGVDDRNSSLHIIQIDQMSLGLPSQDYYLNPSSKKDKEAYYKLMVDIAILLGAEYDYAQQQMQQVLNFETKLANASLPESERQDTNAIYTKLTVQQLSDLIPEFNWLVYLNTFLPIKIDKNEPVVVYCMPYLFNIRSILLETQPHILYNYAIWRLVNYVTIYMGGDYQNKRGEFRKVIAGVTAERLRWSSCVEMINKRLGTAVGSLFIRENFDQESKRTALEMIHNIRAAFNELIDENDWMDNETKHVAKEKANAMNERIGYSETLTNPVEVSKEYEKLQVYESQFLINILKLLKFESARNLEKLRKPVDKDKWTTEPAVVNAFYNPNKNDIVFPAGILQPNFYSHIYPKSLNYGGIGVVIGHEITHGFDAKGRQFDKEGNLKEWWNNATVQKFYERTQCIIDQYSSYVLQEVGLNINGKMTQGENIADNGGLKQAYRAFKKWEKQHGIEPLLPGLDLNHDQLFFLNYAQIWCGSMRNQDALSKIRTSAHSPGPIRVLGPLSNSYDFAKAYNCPLGSRMNPKKKCSVW